MCVTVAFWFEGETGYVKTFCRQSVPVSKLQRTQEPLILFLDVLTLDECIRSDIGGNCSALLDSF